LVKNQICPWLLYRLLKASGREHNTLGMPMNEDFQNNLTLQENGSNMRNYEQTFLYDELGNIREMKSGNTWTRKYIYNFAANNYLQKHDENEQSSYIYDAHGNMTKMPHLQELKWDFKGNLKEVTLDLAGNKAFYTYDAQGVRVRKVVLKGNIKEERYYLGDYEYFEKTVNGDVDITRETLHINDDKQKVALIEGDIIRYQLTNHLGSSSIELDEFADIISYEEYHPFGTTSYRSGRNESEVSLKRYKYVFKELDNETGLYYYGMRFYAAWIGRFVSVDPLQFKYPYYTPFQYAGNRPINFMDLDGAEPVDNDKTNVQKNGQDGLWSVISNSKPVTDNPNNESFRNAQTVTEPHELSWIIFPTSYNWTINSLKDKYSVAYGEKVSNEFRKELFAVSKRLDVNPDYLMTVFAVETIGTFDPAIQSPIKATGLIQITKSTAKGLGTSVDELKKMTATQQLSYVEKYLETYKGKLKTLGDVYLAVHYPVAVGKSDDYVCYEKGDAAYTNNKMNDKNNDDKVTRDEILTTVQRVYNNRTYNFLITE